MYRKILKPTGDFIIAITLIIAFLPLMGVIAAIITINMGTFPIFSQKRPGMNEEIFCMYKPKLVRRILSSIVSD